jgi:hypothetical protein
MPLIWSFEATPKRRGETQPPIRIAPTRCGLADDHADVHRRQCPAGVGRRDDARNHGQDHQSEDVVDDGRSQDDLGFSRLSLAEVGKHSCRDTHTGGTEGRTDEEMDEEILGGQHPTRDPPADEERRDDTCDGYQQARLSDREHLVHVGFEADFEEQQHHADLRQDRDGLVLGEELQTRIAEHQSQVADQDTRDQFAQHRRLGDALGNLATDLGRGQYDHQAQQDGCYRALMSATSMRLAPAMVLGGCGLPVCVGLLLGFMRGFRLGKRFVARVAVTEESDGLSGEEECQQGQGEKCSSHCGGSPSGLEKRCRSLSWCGVDLSTRRSEGGVDSGGDESAGMGGRERLAASVGALPGAARGWACDPAPRCGGGLGGDAAW